MTKINDMTSPDLSILANKWCKMNNLNTTEEKIEYVIEGTVQGEVFLAWVSAHLDLVEIHSLKCDDVETIKNHYDELMKLAIEKCPNFNKALINFSSWVIDNKDILGEIMSRIHTMKE